jgi:nicotinate phosphoribosyltransferase
LYGAGFHGARSELDAFRSFGIYPDDCLLLVDTVDTIDGTNAIQVFEAAP